jgi:hypothetical protein
MRKNCKLKKIDLEILTDFHMPTPQITKRRYFNVVCLSRYVCIMHVWMFASLAPKRLDRFNLYSVFKSFSTIRLCILLQ